MRERDTKNVIRVVALNMIVVGMTTIILGTLLPAMRADYGFDYAFGGTLISATSVGTVLMNLITGFLALRIGQKRSYLALILVGALGFVLMLLTRSSAVLLIACLMTGASKGAGSTYSSGIINRISGEDSSLMNGVHMFFAVGACLAPLILLLSVQGALGWQGAVLILAIAGMIPFTAGLRMKLPEPQAHGEEEKDGFPLHTQQERSGNRERRKNRDRRIDWGFFRERRFWISEGMLFCYMTVETAVIGWIVTFFRDAGVAAESYAQVLNIVCWLAVLVGRLLCAVLAKKVSTPRILLILSVFSLSAFVLMLFLRSLGGMFFVMVLLGLGFSGVFGCCVTNAGELFNRYPVSLGVFTTLASVGAIFVPTIMGAAADRIGIAAAMRILLVFFAGQTVFSVINLIDRKRR